MKIQINREIEVDDCLADEIKELNEKGVFTIASCCGHGRADPTIIIQPSSKSKAQELGYESYISDGHAHNVCIRPKSKCHCKNTEKITLNIAHDQLDLRGLSNNNMHLMYHILETKENNYVFISADVSDPTIYGDSFFMILKDGVEATKQDVIDILLYLCSNYTYAIKKKDFNVDLYMGSFDIYNQTTLKDMLKDIYYSIFFNNETSDDLIIMKTGESKWRAEE
jgi:hypothetical protein